MSFPKTPIAYIFSLICLLPSVIQAQAKHPKKSPYKSLAPVQVQPGQPNIYEAVDKKALLIDDSLTGSTENIASYINSNFNQPQDKVRAAFIWIASNIRYDLPNMYAINYYEKKEDKINKPLQTRLGVCENYAALFTDICQKLTIQSFVIEGYVKQYNHVSDVSHAWCAAKIDTVWYLFDPTWAAGYADKGVFVPKINDDWYKIKPANCIETHMPFDPLWQLLYHPITFTDFASGDRAGKSTTAYFNYDDSIAVYLKQDRVDQDQASYTRIDNNGAKNSQVFNRLQYLRESIEHAKNDQYNVAVANYNDAVNSFNEFIRYRNKQFMPMRPDAEIKAMLDSASVPYNLAKLQLSQIKDPGPNFLTSMTSLQKMMSTFSTSLEEQEAWLTKYMSKSKSGRRGMFTKVTWFGIPLN